MITSSRNGKTKTLESIFSDDARSGALAQEAVLDALREHERNGQSVVVWQDGKVVAHTPEEIPVNIIE